MMSFWQDMPFQSTDLLFGQSNVIDKRDFTLFWLPVPVAGLDNQLKKVCMAPFSTITLIPLPFTVVVL